MFHSIAIISAEKQSASKWKEQLHKDLQLLLDWNRPDLAQSEIFQRDDFSKIKVCALKTFGGKIL